MMDKDGRVTGNMEEVVLLESDAPDLPLWCRLYMAVVRVFTMLLVLAAGESLSCYGVARIYIGLNPCPATPVYIQF